MAFVELKRLDGAIARAQHGTRTCYVGQRCRCALCKAANRDYYRQRQDRVDSLSAEVQLVPTGEPVRIPIGKGRTGFACTGVNGAPCIAGGPWLKGRKVCSACVERVTVRNGLVDPGPALEHLLKLRAAGVGYKSVAAASDVAASALAAILDGSRSSIRADTERAILSVTVDAMADGALIPLGPTLRLVDRLLKRGFTRGGIARLMGQKTRALQLGRQAGQVTARNAAKVARIWRRVEAGELSPQRPYEPGEPIWAALRSLHVAGLSWTFLEERLGFTVQRCGFGPWIRVTSAAKIRAMVAEVVSAWRVGGELPEGWQDHPKAVLAAVQLDERWSAR